MRTILIFVGLFIGLAALLCLCATGRASEPYAIGHYADGYYYQGAGLWRWSDGSLWTRFRYTDSYGRYGWQYQAHYAAPVHVAPKPPSVDDANFEQKLLDFLADKQKRQQRLEMLSAAGLLAPGGMGYAQGGGYGQLANITGTTLYGYSMNAVAGGYAGVDLNVLYQQLARTTENAQQLAGTAHNNHTDAVKEANESNLRLELARAALAGQPKAERREFHFQSGPVAPAPPAAMPPVDETGAGAGPIASPRGFAGLSTKCAACHSGAKVQAGFDVARFDGLPRDTRVRIVLERIMTKDSGKRMPKDGPPLSAAEQKAWLERAMQ